MTCFHPIKAFRSREKTAAGGYGVTFNPHQALVEGSSFSVPCGRCIGCRIARSREWAMRCHHEAKQYLFNCALTLTYDNEHLPDDYSIHVRELQLFIKRLRKSVEPKIVRFFACGEYGDHDQRPHYHVLLFNHQFSDLKLWKRSAKGYDHFTSSELDQVWGKGLATTTTVTYQSAAYVARYNLKKIGGDLAAVHYERVHPLTGQLVRVEPEFMLCSRRPGIGSAWYSEFKSDIFPSDFTVVDGKKHPVPRYYFLKHEEEEREKLKRQRKLVANRQREHMTKERLAVRETVKAAQLKRLKRDL